MIGPFLINRKAFVQEVVQPLQDKAETIYLVPGSDAEQYVASQSSLTVFSQRLRVRNGFARVHKGLNVVIRDQDETAASVASVTSKR